MQVASVLLRESIKPATNHIETACPTVLLVEVRDKLRRVGRLDKNSVDLKPEAAEQRVFIPSEGQSLEGGLVCVARRADDLQASKAVLSANEPGGNMIYIGS